MGNCLITAAASRVVPSGVLVSQGVPDDPFAGQKGWDEMVFVEKREIGLEDEEAAARGLDACHDQVRAMKIFNPNTENPTVVSLPEGKAAIELDMLVAISVFLNVRYVTSLEHVAVHEYTPGSSFVVLIVGDRENVIDGYYRIRVSRASAKVTVDYAKVQSMTSGLMRLMVGKDTYMEQNQVSANWTADLLASYVRDGANHHS